MIFAIISAWLAYKRAKATGRNAILWAFIAAAVFIGTQLVIQFGLGVLLGLGVEILSWSEQTLNIYAILITIFAIIASFGTTWLVLRYLDKVPGAETFSSPPPPPEFDKNN